MSLPTYDHDAAVAAVGHVGGILGAGAGADIDEAFDAAVSAAFDKPTAGPSLVAADPSAVQQTSEPTSADAALVAALAWLRDNPGSGTVAAFPVLGRSAHTRVTRRAVVDGVEFEPDDSPAGRWAAFDEDLAAAVAAAGAGPADGEVLEQVTVVRRARYKPVAAPVKEKSEGQFVVLHGNEIVSRGHRTGGEARRAAVDLVKAMDKDDHTTPQLQVFKLAGRVGGRPLIEVVRTRLKQVLRVKVVYAAAKEAKRPQKVVGWFFVTSATPTAAPVPAGPDAAVADDGDTPAA